MAREQRGSLRLNTSDHTWSLRYRGPAGPDGKRPQHVVQVGRLEQLPDKDAARTEADRIMRRLFPPRLAPGTSLPWPDWCERFALEHVTTLRRGSRKTYISVIQAHLEPAFERRRTHEVTTELIRDWVKLQQRAEVKPGTIRHRLTILRIMLKVAKDAGIEANPPAPHSIRLRKVSTSKRRADRAFRAAELQAILQAPGELWLRTLYVLLASTGLRGGEALALKWSAVDRARGVIEVRASASAGEIGEVKNETSLRDVPIAPGLSAWLDAYQASTRAGPQDLLFPNRRGGPRTTDSVRRHLRRLLDELGLRRLSLHAFRHAATRDLLDSGASAADVRDQLGHGSIATTNTYASGTDAGRRRAIELLEVARHLPAPPDPTKHGVKHFEAEERDGEQ